MASYLYELPTTGAISFAGFLSDALGSSFATHLTSATEARANLRAALKEAKRTDGEKDYLRLVKIIDDYLPYLRGILNCVKCELMIVQPEPVFSWRTTLSATLLQNSPRLSLPSLHVEHAFTLITLGFVLANHARLAIPTALPTYDSLRSLPESERQASNDRVAFAANLLCRASGIFAYVANDILSLWDPAPNVQIPPELTVEVMSALSKMALADAQTLALRKLMSKAASESAISPGPPLPKSHPSPALLAKLHLECASWYSSARALAKTPGATRKSSSSRNHSVKEIDEVHAELRRYLADAVLLHNTLARKWLGVSAGERGGSGEAVGYLTWAQSELNGLKDGGKGLGITGRAKDRKEGMKEKVLDELEEVKMFLKSYQNANNTLHFQSVPSQTELQAMIPAGSAAMQIKPFEPPVPAFGPGSIEQQAEVLNLDNGDDGVPSDAHLTSRPGYAGAGSYY